MSQQVLELPFDGPAQLIGAGGGQFTEADVKWLKDTKEVGGLLTMLIGPRGGGKTTTAAWFVQDSKENYPDVPRISNVPIENAIYVPNILKFLAVKLIVEGGEKSYETKPDGTVHILPRKTKPMRMLIIIDEAAISGFESRGSGLYALNSYLLALSRKLNVDIILISQLMSMVEKRGQWLADFYWLCEAVRFTNGRIEKFTFKIYSESFISQTIYNMDGGAAERRLFNLFDTNDIPNYEELATAFRRQFSITEEDHTLYNAIVRYYRHEGLEINRRDEWLSKRWTAFWRRVDPQERRPDL